MEPPQEPLRCCFGREKQSQKLPPGSVIWKDMRRNASNDAANFGKKHIKQLCSVSTPCINDHHIKEEDLVMVGELSKSLLLRRPGKCLYFGARDQTFHGL